LRLEVEQLIFEGHPRDRFLDNFARQFDISGDAFPAAEAWKRKFVI